MSIHEPLLTADGELLGVSFLTARMTGKRICTEVPKPRPDQTVADPFVRLEWGGGTQVNRLEFDIDIIVFGYARDWDTASLDCRTAFGYMAAATGTQIDGWYLGWCRGTSLPHRSNDPKVPDLRRYRSMVTWRVPGQLITP
ncbi:hypothetical protein [Mycolicibacterium sp.]|uniref:hypothetical protein n=1 Tax=Mycolicibacterium sp. TaxID=2320850 RepID=UPI0037C9EC3D